MTESQFRELVESLRSAGAVWFNNRQLLNLEALIAEAERARNFEEVLILEDANRVEQ